MTKNSKLATNIILFNFVFIRKDKEELGGAGFFLF